MEWIFQCNPSRYDLLSKLQNNAIASTDGNWSMNQHRDLIKAGDRIFFWQSGPNAALIVAGRAASASYDRKSAFGKYAVDIVLEALITPPLTRSEAIANPILRDIEPFKGHLARATNFPLRDPAVVAEIENLLQSRLRALNAQVATESQRAILIGERALLDAIEASHRATAAELLSAVAQMHPRGFEHLIEELLLAIGYEDVELTRYSHDGGVDLTATLVAGGITRIKTAVQVKRTRSVGVDIVQRLRGTLGSAKAAAGLIITSGTFTRDALLDVSEGPGPPIVLIPGQQLVDLLMQHEIGVRTSHAPIYRLALENLPRGDESE